MLFVMEKEIVSLFNNHCYHSPSAQYVAENYILKLKICVMQNTVNDKSYIEKSFVVYYILHNVGKILVVLLLTRTNVNFCIYIGAQNGTYKTKISWGNLRGLYKISKNRKTFFPHSLYCLWYLV